MGLNPSIWMMDASMRFSTAYISSRQAVKALAPCSSTGHGVNWMRLGSTSGGLTTFGSASRGRWAQGEAQGWGLGSVTPERRAVFGDQCQALPGKKMRGEPRAGWSSSESSRMSTATCSGACPTLGERQALAARPPGRLTLEVPCRGSPCMKPPSCIIVGLNRAVFRPGLAVFFQIGTLVNVAG